MLPYSMAFLLLGKFVPRFVPLLTDSPRYNPSFHRNKATKMSERKTPLIPAVSMGLMGFSFGAGDEIRTRDLHLGKVTLYH